MLTILYKGIEHHRFWYLGWVLESIPPGKTIHTSVTTSSTEIQNISITPESFLISFCSQFLLLSLFSLSTIFWKCLVLYT